LCDISFSARTALILFILIFGSIFSGGLRGKANLGYFLHN
jgi:hypothetical protein